MSAGVVNQSRPIFRARSRPVRASKRRVSRLNLYRREASASVISSCDESVTLDMEDKMRRLIAEVEVARAKAVHLRDGRMAREAFGTGLRANYKATKHRTCASNMEAIR